jgi:hypothetical protein
VHTDQGFILDNQNQVFGGFGFGHFYSGIRMGNLRAAYSFPEHSSPQRVIPELTGQAQSS